MLYTRYICYITLYNVRLPISSSDILDTESKPISDMPESFHNIFEQDVKKNIFYPIILSYRKLVKIFLKK